MMGFWLQVVPPLVLLALGYFIGNWFFERRHFRSLNEREATFGDMVVTNLKRIPTPETAVQGSLVMGEAVISADYFKSFLAKFRNLVGGEVKTFVTLMERARREASLRMLEEARRLGATEVHNVRYETSNIRSGSGNNQQGISVEVFAFGTAIIREH